MNRTFETILSAIEETIATERESCCHKLAETIRNLKKQYPNEADVLIARILELLAVYKVDCTRIRETQEYFKSLDDYLEKNVPLAEPLN